MQQIIIRVGRLPEILWALLTLAGFVLATSGIFTVMSGFSYLGDAYTGTAAISHFAGGALMLGFGLIVVAAGYWGIRGKIIFTRD